MPLSKQDYETALSQAAGAPVVLTDNDYQRLVKGQKLSEKAMADAKTRGANAGDGFADEDAGPPLLKPDQPAEMYRPVVKLKDAPPESSSIGRLPYGSEPTYAAEGPALDVDSSGVGFAQLPKYVMEWKGADQSEYGPDDFGFGVGEGDKLYAKAPKGQYEFAPDTVTAKPPAPSSKIDLLARSAFGPAPAMKKKGY